MTMVGVIEVRIELLTAVAGGRHSPIAAGYRPHFRVQNGDGEYLGIQFHELSSEWVHPGEIAQAKVELMYEEVDYSALVEGAKFDIMEGGRIVGSGRVLKI